MKGMFVNCYHLSNIYVDEAKWDTSNVLSSAGGDNGLDMFYNDIKLPNYNKDKCDVTMANAQEGGYLHQGSDPAADKNRFQILFNPGVAPDGKVLTFEDVSNMPNDIINATEDTTLTFTLREFSFRANYYGAALEG